MDIREREDLEEGEREKRKKKTPQTRSSEKRRREEKRKDDKVETKHAIIPLMILPIVLR